MSMNESGKAVRELLAAMLGVSDADAALIELEITAAAGGDPAVRSVQDLVKAGRARTRRIVELDRALTASTATIRGLTAELKRTPVVVPIDPPAGHRWVTGVRGGIAGPETEGRLVCVVCTGGKYGGANETQAPVVLAAECLERNR